MIVIMIGGDITLGQN